MANRFINSGDKPQNPNKHIKNTDDENTQMFSTKNTDALNTAEFKAQIAREEHTSFDGQNAPQKPQTPPQNNVPPQNNSIPPQQTNNNNINNNQQRPPQPPPPPLFNYPNGGYNNNPQGNQQNPPYQQANQNGGYNNQYQQPYNQQNPYGRNPQQNQYNPQNPYGNNSQPYNNQYQQPIRPLNNNPYYNNANVPQNNNTEKPKKKKKKKSSSGFWVKFLVALVVIVVLLFALYSAAVIMLLGRLNHEDTESRYHSGNALSASYVTSILLIGTDGRDVNDRGRSDSMILLSMNSKTDKIYLTSFMRDSFVDIPGYGSNKLNHAYSYGGTELLMDTIEQNFNVEIDKYVKVNFDAFATIIDSVGGIDVQISDDEAQEINNILSNEVNELLGDPSNANLLSGGGNVHLNGKQALSYSRIRYVGNADFERTERQRVVLSKTADQLKSLNPSYLMNIANDAMPKISTNMTIGELYMLSLKLPTLITDDIEQVQIPADNTYWSTTTDDGGDALGFDYDANYAILRDKVFGR